MRAFRITPARRRLLAWIAAGRDARDLTDASHVVPGAPGRFELVLCALVQAGLVRWEGGIDGVELTPAGLAAVARFRPPRPTPR